MLFVWLLPFDLFGIGDPNRSLKAPADIALGVTGARKPHHHVQGGNPIGAEDTT